MYLMDIDIPPIITQRVNIQYPCGVELYIKREDKTHPKVSGNKYRKLKYNIEKAVETKKNKLITFGGAYSNHIAATAVAGKIFKLKTIGVIRGEELKDKVQDNPTLSFARECGMEFLFVSRENFREKNTEKFKERLFDMFGDYYFVPEGGTNELAVRGCQEILNEKDKEFDVICCAMGTGGTLSGLINSAEEKQTVLGFSALKAGEFLSQVVNKYTKGKGNWSITSNYSLGGYAKVNDKFIAFLNGFYNKTGIPLDPVYTGKMVYGITDMAERGFFKENAKILAIHTGGLQGIAGMNKYLLKKGKNILDYEKEIG